MASRASHYRQLRDLIEELKQVAAAGMSKSKAKAALREVEQARAQLEFLAQELDPIRRPQNVFDPKDPAIIGLFVGIALVAQERIRLDQVERFYGSGVYALYYDGVFPPYAPICQTEHPIYAGKADPKDPRATLPIDQGDRLFARLNDHRKSISRAQNLRIDDFKCRYLVVQSGLQKAAEDYLLNLFHPLWNGWGIGKHGDTATLRQHPRSPWDSLHPGRRWARPSPEGKPVSSIEIEINAHFSRFPPYKKIDEILVVFYEQMKQK